MIRFVKDASSAAVLDCLLKALVIDVSIARELAESETIAQALVPEHYQQLQEKVDEATVTTLVDGLQGPIKERNWVEVVRQLDELVARQEAGRSEQKRVMEIVRAGVAEDISAKVAAGIGKRSGADDLLAEVDALIAAAHWVQGRGVKDDAVPEAVGAERELAAFWAECAAVDCKLVAPAPVWAYGSVAVKPVLDLAGETVKVVKHATKLWRIAESSSWILLAAHDPGTLDDLRARLPVALGWAHNGAMRSEDTSEWLPPADALVGTRVWGPLRPGEQTWELGTVVGAAGGQLDVKRLADLASVQVPAAQVRFGTIKEGTKVLAMCRQPLTPEAAVIERVIDSGAGDPVATLACLEPDGRPGSLKSQVQLGSLRTKPGWLPPRR